MKAKGPGTLREALLDKLTKEELEKLRTSFDIVGDIAIIEIPPELVAKENIIARTILDMHKNILVVCKKIGGHSGEYRRQKLRIIGGKRRKQTMYKENNARILLHVQDCYFSPRLSTERKRISELIKQGEDVLVMFSGVAPYPVVFSRNSPAKEIYAVEKNPIAHKYALENIRLNKLTNVHAFQGDARTVVPGLGKKFDRILMPLPKGGMDFLDVALGAAKKGAVVHYYDFLHEDEFDDAKRKVREACLKAGRKCVFENFRKCGQQSPRTYRIVLDFSVS